MTSKAEKQNSVMFIVCLIIFIIFVSIGLGVCFGSLVPSINKAKGYDKGQCTVVRSSIIADCYSDECATYNDDIWWYPYWGPSYFFVYVGGGTDSSYNNGDDDGDEDDDGESGDGGDDDDDDDGGDSGGFEDGDSGGGDFSGIGGGDEIKAYLKSFPSTTGGFAGNKEIKAVSSMLRRGQISKKQVLDSLLSKSVANVDDTASASSESSWSSGESANCGYNYCAQGVNYVILNYYDGQLNTSVRGLWDSDYGWVSSYTSNFEVGSTYDCYYQSEQPENVMWFPPPKYNNGSLVLTSVILSLAFISLIATLIYAFKWYQAKHLHHHQHHSEHKPIHHNKKNNTSHKKKTTTTTTTKTDEQSNYRVVYQALPNDYNNLPPQGNYYQYSYGVPYIPGNGVSQPAAPSINQIN